MNVLQSAPFNSRGSRTQKPTNPKSRMQFLLCDDTDDNPEQPNALPEEPAKRPAMKLKLGKRRLPAAEWRPVTTISVIPDKDRKRSYRLTTKQRLRREENEALASRTYNLMLDINNLKQEVRYLEECRALRFMHLAVTRQHSQGEAVSMVTRLFRLFCGETCGTNEMEPDDRNIFLSRVHSRLTDRAAGGRDGVPHFMLLWRNFKVLFTHRSYTVKSIRLVSHVGPQEDTEDPGDTICTDVLDEAMQRCGPTGGCVVESLGEFTGRLKRDTIAAISPNLLQNEALMVRLIGQKLSCPLRILAYFNAEGQLVDHVAEFNVIGALNAVIEIAGHR